MSPVGRPWGALFVAFVALAAVFAVFEFTELDLALQDRLFDFATGTWIVDAKDPVGRALFYNGPKYAIIATALAVLVLSLGPSRWREKARVGRPGLFVALLTLITVPVLVGASKANTNVFCPSEIRRYGGDVPYVKVLERFPADDRPARKGRCFPAGHSSGGFALIGLLWLRRSRAWRNGIIALTMATGWWMGGYQMLKGAHYLSHTLVTMVFAIFVLLIWRCVIPERSEHGAD